VRQLAAWEGQKEELEQLGCTIIAASVDSLEQARETMEKAGASFDFAYGVTKEESEIFGAWWTVDHHGGYIQPSEFLLSRGGVVFGALYASGPIGRMGVDEAVRSITNRERRRREQEGAGR
jgi:peroxiredoxin